MKTLKTFSIDADFNERLKNEENQSELINRLLSDYFKRKDLDDMTPEQIKTELKIIELQEKTDKKIKEMRQNGR